MNPPTHASVLTPPGTGAIATIAVSGPDAIRIVSQLFQAPQLLPSDPSLFRFGKFGEQTADEVVVRIRRTNAVPCVELHCHGGREVVCMILEALRQHGICIGTGSEGGSLTDDAARLLAQAPTVRTAAILLDQYHGAFDEARKAVNGIERLDEIARWIPVGLHLVEPWQVVVAGPVNAGKSSLVNAIAGFQRSVVSPIPGTTRDVVRVKIALDGWPVELLDTAGLRDQAGSLETQGIRLAEEAMAKADLCLWLLDGTDPHPPPPPGTLGPHVLTVINKTDLPAAWNFAQTAGAIHVSARTGDGLAELCQGIVRLLVPESPPAGAAVPFTPQLCRQIEDARKARNDGNTVLARRILQSLSSPAYCTEPTN